MEQVVIQDCGCIALPGEIADALDLKRGMTLDVELTETRDAILLTPHHSGPTSTGVESSERVPIANCVILPPLR
jgi:hypothetical protein